MGERKEKRGEERDPDASDESERKEQVGRERGEAKYSGREKLCRRLSKGTTSSGSARGRREKGLPSPSSPEVAGLSSYLGSP